ncbi:ABC transporter ATP-binding protein [Dongia sedimenti]|uniref:ABC transporter ATP-binding protein n=1 Tax=Dongia sedimenti TaxID=3064282 RepID=A0ABU0YUV6_9PROT|nr:ABC transporter ATP-binding protein [Rhodospirillaceae bacterium R-7]
MRAGVELDHVTVRFGEFTAVKDATLDIRGGEFFSFLGPSGCGKTTILRTISGFLDPSEGKVRIGGQDMNGIGPNKRPTALIFQNLALFPLMSVAENITYGLRVRGVSKADRMKRANELLEQIALPGQGDKLVSELSGGQKQRVAIARALAVQPKVLLLDEPLSALDLKLRQHMRAELRSIQQQVGITFIYITHDQGEALTMSDRIAVMSDGVIQQIADGRNVYDEPATAFVASFVGENNAFAGTVARADNTFAVLDTPFGPLRGRNPKGLKSGDRAILFVRPESARLARGEGDTTLSSRVKNIAFEGNMTHVFLDGAGKKDITVTVGRQDGASIPEQGADAAISYNPALGLVLPDGKLARE